MDIFIIWLKRTLFIALIFRPCARSEIQRPPNATAVTLESRDSATTSGRKAVTSESYVIFKTSDVRYMTEAISGIPSTTPKTTKSSMNLAILPVLAVLIFIICVCLKCCKWFRDNVKQRDGDSMNEGSFVILTEGDNEYRDVEFRSDTNSFYDTVSSYTSFVKLGNNYDTVTSVRSLQIPKHYDIQNSYRSFLSQRLENSRCNTINSYKSMLRNAVEMKDVEVQVELLDVPPIIEKSNRQMCSSCDAIVTHSSYKRPNSFEHYNEVIVDPSVKLPNIKRSHPHRVSFANSRGTRMVPSRSLSLTDAERSKSHDDTNNSKRFEKHKCDSPGRSVKQLWGIRPSPREQVRNVKILSPTRSDRSPRIMAEYTTSTVRNASTSIYSKQHRFKVSKTDETVLSNYPNIHHHFETCCEDNCLNPQHECASSSGNTKTNPCNGSSKANSQLPNSKIVLDRQSSPRLTIAEEVPNSIYQTILSVNSKCLSQQRAVWSSDENDISSSVTTICNEVSQLESPEETNPLEYYQDSSTSRQTRDPNDTLSSSDDTDSGVCNEMAPCVVLPVEGLR